MSRGIKLPWKPVKTRIDFGPVPPAGAIIEAEGRRLVKVVEVRDIDPVDWGDADCAAYDAMAERCKRKPAPARADWPDRPRVLALRLMVAGRETGKAKHWALRPYAAPFRTWKVAPEHYAVCAVCGEPYPCLHVEAEDQALHAMQMLEPYLSRQPGCCWACGDPISNRVRKWIEFDGINIALPTGPSPVVFHLGRPDCRTEAIAYENEWVAVDPEHRQRRLRCEGNLVIHLDGPDCSEPHCPGPDKRHDSFDDHRNGIVSCLRCADARAHAAAS